MNWFYAEAGQQIGPIDETQFDELVRLGKIQDHTLVWREGMPNWQPYREVCPLKPHESPLLPTVPAVAPTPTGLTQADLLARDYTVEIGECFSRGWQVFKESAGIMIGVSVLVYAAILAANIIPYLNFVLGIIFNGPLLGGLWFFYIRKIRNQEAGIEEAFSGFGPRFWQMVMTKLIPILIALGFIVVIAVFVALTIPAIFMGKRFLGGGATVSPLLFISLCFLFVTFICVMIYLNTCWMFALPLVADKGLKFWPALELSRRVVIKHWWMTFLLTLVCGIVSAFGVIACCVGVLVTGPVAFAALTCHYNRVFGDLAQSEPQNSFQLGADFRR